MELNTTVHVYTKQRREFGKQAGQTVMAAPVTGDNASRPFHIRDYTSGSDFSVDAGAEISIVTLQLYQRWHTMSTGSSLIAANETVIKTYGDQSPILNLRLRWRFTWVFIVTQVKQSILRDDFFGACDLLVDMNGKMVDKNTRLQMNGTLTTNYEIHCVRAIKQVNEFLIECILPLLLKFVTFFTCLYIIFLLAFPFNLPTFISQKYFIYDGVPLIWHLILWLNVVH